MYANGAKKPTPRGIDIADLTDVEVAQLLRKSVRTIQRWCRDAKLHGAYKAGRSWRIPADALTKAGLGKALQPGDVASEIDAAHRMIDALNSDLEQATRTKQRPAIRCNWRRVARSAENLAQSSRQLAELAGLAPEHFSD